MAHRRDDNQELQPRTYRRDSGAPWLAVILSGALLTGIIGLADPTSPFRRGGVISAIFTVAAVAIAAIAVRSILEWSRGRTTISDEGLDVTDWQGRDVHVPWANIWSMWMGTERKSEWLRVELLGDEQRPQVVSLLARPPRSADIEQLRDMIAARARLTEAEPAKTLWLRPAKRVWRRV